MTNSKTNFLNYCANCGTIIKEGIFCSDKCRDLAYEAYEIDMAEMPQEPLCDVIEKDLCPVCQDRPKSSGMATCLNSECRDCWSIAWRK